MKVKLLAFLLALLWINFTTLAVNPQIHVVPKPAKTKILKGNFAIKDGMEIAWPETTPELQHIALQIADHLRLAGGPNLTVVSQSKENRKNNAILLTIRTGEYPPEGYRMIVKPDQVSITGGSGAGVFYGMQTLLQLLPAEVFGNGSDGKNVQWTLPCVDIKDQPRYPYRGMHLDVSRHFFPKEFVKKYIDLMSMYKLNTFQWHLTDDNGWRIEIKKYPKLTQIGAWHVDHEDLPWTERPAQKPGEAATYGGFYTQDDIRDVVAYANERYVTIIPEIEMPAHSIEVLAAYPQLSCTGGPFTVPPGSYWPNTEILCAGNDSTFTFLQDVLSEVIDLFPSKYIHIGGDEADKTRWKECPKCQARIKAEGRKDEKELQSYFIRRIEKFLISKNRKMIGWDEILEGGLAPEATVMSWRGVDGGIAAAKQGHDVIMTPTSYCYFDYYQANPKTEPKSIGGMVTLKKVYSLEPTPHELTAEQSKHILGAQANLWAEYIPTTSHAEYMALPRMLALAEVVWSPRNQRDWTDFRTRVTKQFKILDQLHVNYCKGSFRVSVSMDWDKKQQQLRCRLESEQPGWPIVYTLDGNDPNPASIIYTFPFPINSNCYLKAGILKDGTFPDPLTERTIIFHHAVGKKVTYLKPFSYRYTAGGGGALVDGLRGTSDHRDGNWQGFLGNDMDVIIDLGKEEPVRTVAATFLQNSTSWIFLPDSVTISLSANGKKFHSINEQGNSTSKKTDKPVIQEFSQTFPDTPARYIRVHAKNTGVCPSWHDGAGEPCWLFADEIMVY
jgi:hexosaminidase